jgi:hypothetical protein
LSWLTSACHAPFSESGNAAVFEADVAPLRDQVLKVGRRIYHLPKYGVGAVDAGTDYRIIVQIHIGLGDLIFKKQELLGFIAAKPCEILRFSAAG